MRLGKLQHYALAIKCPTCCQDPGKPCVRLSPDEPVLRFAHHKRLPPILHEDRPPIVVPPWLATKVA